MILAIGLVQIPYTNRVVRLAVLAAKAETYIDAARVLGASDNRIMLNEPRQFLAPSVALLLTVLGWNLAGDALRDLLDPKMRRRE